MHTIAIVKEVCYFKSAKIADHRFIQRLKDGLNLQNCSKKFYPENFI